MQKIFQLLILFCVIILSSCQKEIELNFPAEEPPIVIEGYVENGQRPFVLISTGIPFLGTLSLTDFQKYFVSGADVTVSDGITSEKLIELKFNGFISYFGNNLGETGKTYTLTIKYNSKTYTAVTEIKPSIALDSIWHVPSPTTDTLVTLMCLLNEPPEHGNKYRALTRRNSEPIFDTDFRSVFDDALVNGKKFEFNINRGKSTFTNNDSANFEEYGYFKKGDTIYVKWASINDVHFNFWSSFESQGQSLGNPFSPTVIVKSNIKGDKATGIWGSYGAFYDTLIVK